jgi:hypothetical protein
MISVNPEALKYGALCIGSLVLLCVFFILISPSPLAIQIKPLVLHSKLCLEQSRQDKNPMFALKHAVEGLTYIQMTRKLASDGKIQEITNMSPSDLEEIFQESILNITASTETPK